MSRPLPIVCAYGDRSHHAAYAVDGPTREVVTCLAHLPQARRWVGARATTEPLPGHDPPPEQDALF